MADIVILEIGPLWDIDEVKAHLRVESDDEDDLISAYMEAAEQAMLRFCNLALVPLGRQAVFKQAGFLTVTSFYETRGGGEDIPVAARNLIWPYRVPV